MLSLDYLVSLSNFLYKTGGKNGKLFFHGRYGFFWLYVNHEPGFGFYDGGVSANHSCTPKKNSAEKSAAETGGSEDSRSKFSFKKIGGWGE